MPFIFIEEIFSPIFFFNAFSVHFLLAQSFVSQIRNGAEMEFAYGKIAFHESQIICHGFVVVIIVVVVRAIVPIMLSLEMDCFELFLSVVLPLCLALPFQINLIEIL